MDQFSYWKKCLAKFHRIRDRMGRARSTRELHRLQRKLDILARRLIRMNRPWRTGIATVTLIAWLQAPVSAQLFPAEFDLATLDGSNGFRIRGLMDSTSIRHSASAGGDINGDGIADLVLGKVDFGFDLDIYPGEAYVIFGSDSGFGPDIALDSLDGSNGFRIPEESLGDAMGFSVSSLGDINGDGLDDLIVGAPYANGYAGKAYVIFGKTDGFSPAFDLAGLDGNNGFSISGNGSINNIGLRVTGLGDINGDGLSDFGLSDPFQNYDAGEVYVVFGRDTGFAETLNLDTLDGSNGFTIGGLSNFDYLGFSLSGLGDINGDGLDDFAAGARFASPAGLDYAGEVYVIFGRDTGFSSAIDLDSLNGNNGFRIPGPEADIALGTSVHGGGDLNGDGLNDLIVGAPYADGYAGNAYVIFGDADGFPATFELDGLDGNNGFRIPGLDEAGYLGYNVHLDGDFNGDGIDDLTVSAPLASPNGTAYAGETYVVFGSSNGFPSTVDLSALDGFTGFRIAGLSEFDYSGFTAGAAGDLDGDQVDDLFVSTAYSPEGRGAVYVVFGRDVEVSTFAPAAELPVRVFPNPASGSLWVELYEPQEALLSLYDPLGRTLQVKAIEMGGGAYRFDLPEGLAAGVYSLRIQTESGIASEKVIIR